MRKKLISSLLLAMMVILAVEPVSAKKMKTNIKGEITGISGETLTVSTRKGESYTVAVPQGFDMNSIQIGESVLVKASIKEDGSLQADVIKLVGKGQGQEKKEKDDKAKEGSKENGAYCAEGKSSKLHPLASKTAERYGVTEVWVMENFCGGYSIGAIMMALKTSQIDGVDMDPADLLAERSGGNGWGKIWQELGLIGSEKEGHSPPGQLKKQGGL